MTRSPFPTQIVIPLHPNPHQVAQLHAVGERLNELRVWTYEQANGELHPHVTLALMSGGAPAASREVADEVAALRRLARYGDIPAGVLTQTIADERAVIAAELQRAGRLRAVSDLPVCYDVDISGDDWCAVWTPELVTLDGICGPVDAELTAASVPANLRRAWGGRRVAWCDWMMAPSGAADTRERAAFAVDRQRYEQAAGDLGTVGELREAWEAPTAELTGGAGRFLWRVSQPEARWCLTLTLKGQPAR